jgi:hypothetical protein
MFETYETSRSILGIERQSFKLWDNYETYET